MSGLAEIESSNRQDCITSAWNDWTASDLPNSPTFSDLDKSDPVLPFQSDVMQSCLFNLSATMHLVLFIHAWHTDV